LRFQQKPIVPKISELSKRAGALGIETLHIGQRSLSQSPVSILSPPQNALMTPGRAMVEHSQIVVAGHPDDAVDMPGDGLAAGGPDALSWPQREENDAQPEKQQNRAGVGTATRSTLARAVIS
jgi:hypothetical protein